MNYSFILVACLVLGFSGCTKPENNPTKPKSYKVLIPFGEWGQEASLVPVTLEGIRDFDSLLGVHAQFLFAPKVENKFEGTRVSLQFSQAEDDLWVPMNSLSRDAATAYAHIQKLHHMDKELGIDSINKWPLNIGISVRMKDSSGDYLMSNSFYDGKSDSILIVPYADGRLPISQNGGIIAHEHFHSFFYKKVVSPLVEEGRLNKSVSAHVHEEVDIALDHFYEKENSTPEQIYDYVLIKAMNEGFADYWGWVYTGQDEFVAESLPSEKGKRSLKEEKLGSEVPKLVTREVLLDKIKVIVDQKPQSLQMFVNRVAYQLGTSYSRILVNLAQTTAQSHGITLQQAGMLNAKKLVASLEGLRTRMLQFTEPGAEDLTLFMDALIEQEMNEQELQLMESYKPGEKK